MFSPNFNLKTVKGVRKDNRRRKMFIKSETKRMLLRAISRDINLPLSIRGKAHDTLAELPKNTSLSRVKNRCIISGRARAIDKRFKLSRIEVKKAVLNGHFSGVHKSSF